MDGNNKNTVFAVETKGNCFLCFEHYVEEGVEKRDGERGGRSVSFKLLSRYLNLDIPQVFNIPSVSFHSSVLENSQIVVPVCDNCLILTNQFSHLYEQLDIVKIQLNACVQNMHDVMVQAEKDFGLEYRERILRSLNPDPVDVINHGIMQNLRKETINKSSIRLQNSFPRLKLARLTSSETNKYLRITKTSSFSVHARSHGDKLATCHLCGSSFTVNGGLTRHKMTVHKEMFFKTFKDSRVTDGNFRYAVNEAFSDFQFEKIGKKYYCPFCDTKNAFQRKELTPHIIRHHKSDFVPTIMAAQAKYITGNIDDDDALNIPLAVTLNRSEIINCDDKDGTMVPLDYMVPNTTTVTSLEPSNDIVLFDTILQDDIPNNSEASTSPSNQLPAFNHAEQSSTIQKCQINEEEKPYLCHTCSKRFINAGNLKTHQLFTHRAVFFQSYKDPRVPFSIFEELVEEVFEKLSFPLDGKHLFQCSFCQTPGFSARNHIMSHTIHKHSDKILSLLMTMQSNCVVQIREGGGGHVRLSQESELSSTNEIHLCKFCPETATKAWDIHLHTVKHHWAEILSKFRDPIDKDEDSEIKLIKLVRTYVNGLSETNNRTYCRICETRFNSIIDAEVHVLQDHMSEGKLEKRLDIKGNPDMGSVVDNCNHEPTPVVLTLDNFLVDAILTDDNVGLCLEIGDDEGMMEVTIES